jgi:hypothetical protein
MLLLGILRNPFILSRHCHCLKNNGKLDCDSNTAKDKLFVNSSLDIKESDEHALDFTLPVSPFSVSVSLDFSIGRIVALTRGHNCKSSFWYQ